MDPEKKKVWTLFSLLNMESPKVQKVSYWLSKSYYLPGNSIFDGKICIHFFSKNGGICIHSFVPLIDGHWMDKNHQKSLASWWFFTNPFEKYASSSKWVDSSSPIFGVKIPKMFELPPPSNHLGMILSTKLFKKYHRWKKFKQCSLDMTCGTSIKSFDLHRIWICTLKGP